MRILQANVAAFVSNTLINVRAGLQAAQAAGVTFDGLPKEFPFTLEIVHSAQSLVSLTASVSDRSAESELSTEAAATTTVTEAAATDVDTVARTAGDINTEGGSDTEETAYTYGEYT